MKGFLILCLVFALNSCQSQIDNKDENQKTSQEFILEEEDSMDREARASLDSSINATIQMPDANIEDLNIDLKYSSGTVVRYDKNNVAWESKEKNLFRFVYKKDIDKLIVYKNTIEFKTYIHPVIPIADNWGDKLDNLQANGKVIFIDKLGYQEFAPSGFNNGSTYYIFEGKRKE